MLFKSLMTGGEAQAVRTQEKVSKGRVTLTELSFNLIDLNRNKIIEKIPDHLNLSKNNDDNLIIIPIQVIKNNKYVIKINNSKKLILF